MFTLDLLTPNGAIVKNVECDEVLIPTCRGEINILPDHTHVLTTLGTGILTVRKGETKKYYSITHGTCKILGDKISILSSTSETADKIDIDRAKRALEKAEKKLKGEESLTEVEMIKFQRKLERAKTRIEIGYLRGA